MSKRKSKKVRPFRTLYYLSDTVKEDAWTSQGHSGSEDGALRACGGRLLTGRATIARVYDEDDTLIHTFRRTEAGGVSVGFGRSVPQLRRVK